MAAKKTIIIVGGAYGGLRAASTARQFNEQARIILVDPSPLSDNAHISRRQCLLSDDDGIYARGLEQDREFSQRYQVEIRHNTKAVALDVDARFLHIDCLGEKARLSFDELIYAGESVANNLLVTGLFGPRVVNFHRSEDIKAIKAAQKNGAKSAVILGCGPSGIDAAISMKMAGFSVRVIENRKRIMSAFSLQFAQTMLEVLLGLKIEVSLGINLSFAQELAHGGFKLQLSSGEEIEADVVVVCVGISPKTDLLANAQAAFDAQGLIRVDDKMATTLPNIYACGSAVSVPYAVTGERKWLPEPAIFLRTAQIAGRNAAVMDLNDIDVVKPFCGTSIIQIGDTHFSRTGLSELEARYLLGDEAVMVTTVFGSEDLVDQETMCVRLIIDKSGNRIVGGEVFGKSGVERRIDLLSVAVLEGFSPAHLIDLDMACPSSMGPITDPLKDAAMRASIALEKTMPIMSAELLALWLNNHHDFRLVDVGKDPLLSGGLMKKTLHLPLETLRERVDELLLHDSPIVLYSKSGHRSFLAQQMLFQRGLKNVFNLDGGLATFQLVAAKE